MDRKERVNKLVNLARFNIAKFRADFNMVSADYTLKYHRSNSQDEINPNHEFSLYMEAWNVYVSTEKPKLPKPFKQRPYNVIPESHKKKSKNLYNHFQSLLENEDAN